MTTHDERVASGGYGLPAVISAIVLLYVALAMAGVPQSATHEIVTEQAAHGAAEPVAHDRTAKQSAVQHEPDGSPPAWMVLPFGVLLGAIAVLPLIPGVSHHWESNLNRFLFAASLAFIVLGYYGFAHKSPVVAHWPAHHVVVADDASSFQVGFVKAVVGNAVLSEYIPFIVLLFSLYTISGGIRISGNLQAHPTTNAMFMVVGTVLASIIGTTGAAMLLIRPLLETNRERKHVAHTVVFFIFTVCNCGGCLLPLGDPPLFLGYLQGVPFTWTLVLWKEWMFVNGVLLVIYLLLDALWFYRREAKRDVQREIDRQHRLRIAGWQLNVPLLLGVVLSVAFLDPGKPLPGTTWHAWLYLREIVQLALVAASLFFGSRHTRGANRFNYAAILEVAAIFIGIFITMQPALQLLGVHGADLGIRTPAQFFWATGALSGVLDNAPTYLVFFQAAQAMPHAPGIELVAGVEHLVLVGISLGAVFMGALTYIGNGPNFMVRAIAEEQGVKMPSFFGYMVYSVLFLLPVLAAMVWIYLSFPS